MTETGDQPPDVGPSEPPASDSIGVTEDEGPGLAAETLDEFIVWAASVPVGAVQRVRDDIAGARERGDERLVEKLASELWRLPVADVSRHMVLLAIIGELADSRLAEPLSNFVWYTPLVDERLHGRPNGCSFEAPPDEMLQARAAEMLSYLATDEADRNILRVVLEHPSVSVRAAAIDAHLYNHGDSAEEIERLRNAVRTEDAPLVGVPRFTRSGDTEDFERAVEDFYRRNPDHLAPGVHSGPVPEDRNMTKRGAE